MHTSSFCCSNINCKAVIPLRSLRGENISEQGSKRKPSSGMQRPLFCGSLTHFPDMSVMLSSLKVLITHGDDYPGLHHPEMTQPHSSQTSRRLLLAVPAGLPGPETAHPEVRSPSPLTFTTTVSVTGGFVSCLFFPHQVCLICHLFLEGGSCRLERDQRGKGTKHGPL